MPRVLLVVPRGDVGGVQTHVADLAAGLVTRGVSVVVASGTSGHLTDALRAQNIETVVVPMRRRTDGAAIRALTRLIRDRQIDLVHTHSPLAGILGRHAALRAGRPCVHTLHGQGILDELRHPHSLWHRIKLLTYQVQERRLNAKSAAIIALSPSLAQAAVRARHAAADRLAVVPHGVPIPPKAARNGASLTVVYVGRLHPEKGVDDLVAAFAEVRRQVPTATLLLIGDGPMRERLRAQKDAAGLGRSVLMPGEKAELAAAFSDAACVVLPSRAEGLSYVLLEAMASGVPVIATAVGATPELIEDGRTGLLVAPGDRAALVRAILSLLRDPSRGAALGASARETVRTRYGRETMIERTLDVYGAALRRRP